MKPKVDMSLQIIEAIEAWRWRDGLARAPRLPASCLRRHRKCGFWTRPGRGHEINGDGGGSGVEAVFNQFFDDRGGTFNNLAGGNQADKGFGKFLNFPQGE